MFTIEGLSVRYGKFSVLSDLNLTIQTPSVFGLVGLNGAGKTTLFNALTGIVNYSARRIDFNGTALDYSRIAYLESDSYFYPDITGNDYLRVFKRKYTKFPIESWQEIFGLPLEQPVEHYSAGMKKKLALLGALALDKELLLLDEPYNSLDLESVQILQVIIVRVKEIGKTVILSSHILDSLIPVCDSIGILSSGRIEKVYSSSDYENLQKIFNYYIDEKYGSIIRDALPKEETDR